MPADAAERIECRQAPERLIESRPQAAAASSTSRSQSGAGALTTAAIAAAAASDIATRKIQLRSGAPTPMIVLCTPSGTSSPPASTGWRPPGPVYAAAALLLYVISLVIAGARWRGFLRALGGEVTRARARRWRRWAGSRPGNLTPAPGGEACRIGLVRLGGRATWPQATVAAVWDRLSELPPILVLGGNGACRRAVARRQDGGTASSRSRSAAAAASASSRSGARRRRGSRSTGWRRRLAAPSRERRSLRRRRRLFVAAVAPGLPATDMRDAGVRRQCWRRRRSPRSRFSPCSAASVPAIAGLGRSRAVSWRG